MTGALWPSALVAAVFAVHPLRVESVAWVAERKDVLSGLFFMLTLWAYVGYVGRPVLAGSATWLVVAAVRPGADGQADAGHAAVRAAAVGLLAAGPFAPAGRAGKRARAARNARGRPAVLEKIPAAGAWRPRRAWSRCWPKARRIIRLAAAALALADGQCPW